MLIKIINKVEFLSRALYGARLFNLRFSNNHCQGRQVYGIIQLKK